MTTPASISQISERVRPLAGKQPTMPIAAHEWNVVIDTLLEVLRLEALQQQTANTLLEQKYALREHAHIGAVAFDWLNADLQSRIGAGVNAATQAAVSGLTQKFTRTSEDVKRLSDDAGTLQRSIERFAVNDVDRAQAVRSLEAQVLRLADHEPRMTRIDSDLRIVNEKLVKVLDLERRLVDSDGKPIDFAGLESEIRAFDDVREAVSDADGKLIQVRQLQLELNELKDIAGAGSALEQRFLGLEERLTKKMQETLDTRLAGMEARLNAALQSAAEASTLALSAAESRIGAEVAAADAKVKKDLQDEIAAVRTGFAAADTALETRVNRRMDDADTRIRTDFAAADAAVETRLNTAVQNANSTGSVALSAAEARLNKRMDDADVRIRGEFAAADTALEARTKVSDAQIRTDLAAADTTLEARVNKRMDDADTRIRTDFAAADTTVRAEFAAGDTKIRSDFTGVAATIRADFIAADSVVAKRVDDTAVKIRSEFAIVDTAIRKEFAAADAQIRLDFAAADKAISTTLEEKANAIGGQLELIASAARLGISELKGRADGIDAKITNHEGRIKKLEGAPNTTPTRPAV